ncbi:MAG: hypothetical protein HYU36_05790 [Planctomycetes bacterium]|nr:hypothetical protein [Planctomycetota bacterium]
MRVVNITSEKVNTVFRTFTLVSLFALPAWADLLPRESLPWPALRIPKIEKPPVIDGEMSQEEWADAAAITGFHPIYLEETHSVWYLAYDDEWLYMAMHSPHYEGTWPTAKGRPNPHGDSGMGWDAHVEIELSYHPRQEASQKGFYIIHINPRDAVMDQHFNYLPGQPGHEWQCERKLKSKANDRFWDMELALKRTSLTTQSFDNTEWILHLVRADGFAGDHFFAWKYSWYVNTWDFPAVYFDPEAPSFRFLRLGEVCKGRLNTIIELVGRSKRRLIELSVRSGTYQKEEKVTLDPGECKRLQFQKEPDGTSPEIRAYLIKEDGQKVTLYEHAVQGGSFKGEEWRQEEIQRRKNLITNFQCNFAYYPSVNTGRAQVDNDIFGMPEEYARCRKFRVHVVSRDKREQPLAIAEGEINPKSLYGEVAVSLPDLPEGNYEATFELVNPEGQVAGTNSVSFARRRYPWEGNSIGKEKVVIPPFTPLIVEGRGIKPWGRTYEMETNGLLRRLVHTGDNLLRDPVRLESIEEGQAVQLLGRDLKISPTDPNGHTVSVESRGSLGSVDVTVKGEMEYDGFYLVTLELQPKEPTSLEKLDLVIPLWPEADTAFLKAGQFIASGSYCGDFPRGKGIVWDGKKEGLTGLIPTCFAGTGDKGIVWEAESTDGWNMKPGESSILLERQNGQPNFRVRMFHEPTLLEGTRTIRFALWGSPTKPMRSDWRKVAWGAQNYIAWNANSGYRFYGDGVNSFTLPSDEHFKKLHDALFNNQFWVNQGLWDWNGTGWESLKKGRALILYGSNMGAGMAMKELESYSGEWLDGAWPENPAPENNKGLWNWGNSVQFNEPRQLAAAFCNVCPSYIDCYLWYHQKYVRLVGLQGTWWDNANIYTCWTPERNTAKKIYRWNPFIRREFCKRLATMCSLEGKEPWWVENTGGMQTSFNTLLIDWEGDFHFPRETTFYERFPMDKYRAFLTANRGVIHWIVVQGEGADDPKKNSLIHRSDVAIRLLHDIGSNHYGHLGVPQGPFDFFDDARNLEFIGYWRSRPFARFVPSRAMATPSSSVIHHNPYISIYRNTRQRSSLIIIANAGPEPLEGALHLNRDYLVANPLLPDTPKDAILLDCEKSKNLVRNPRTGEWFEELKEGGEADDRWVPVDLPAYDHRVFVLQ